MHVQSKPTCSLLSRLALAAVTGFVARVGGVQGYPLRSLAAFVALFGKPAEVGALKDVPLVLFVMYFVKYYGSKWAFVEWLESEVAEDAIDADRPIIDAHHHLVSVPTQAAQRGMPVPAFLPSNVLSTMFAWSDVFTFLLPRDFGDSFGSAARNPFFLTYFSKEYVDDINNAYPVPTGKKGHNVQKTVYMECGWKDANVARGLEKVGEVQFAYDQGAAVAASKIKVCDKVVASAELTLGEGIEECLIQYAKRGVTGIRHMIASTAKEMNQVTLVPAHLPMDAAFRKGYALLAKYNMSFDTWCFQNQLLELADLAETFPDVVMIVDHVGGLITKEGYLGSAEERYAEWLTGLTRLSKLPNVRLKVSGLPMHLAFGHVFAYKKTPPTSAQLAEAWKPYLLKCIELFGANRCMFASNFPVDKLCGSFTLIFNAYKLATKDLTEEQKHYVFYQTAAETYHMQ